jgi:hypothetical protein
MAAFDFVSRGVGLDTTPGCFICGGGRAMRPNIAAFVASRQDGEAIVRLFGQGAWLDYRDFEPNWIQVKVGACQIHLGALERLHQITKRSRSIDAEAIAAAKQE